MFKGTRKNFFPQVIYLMKMPPSSPHCAIILIIKKHALLNLYLNLFDISNHFPYSHSLA